VNLDPVRQIADAVLYEGYLLYPYRASALKNRSRWQFGVVMPAAYRHTDPSDHTATQAECVVEGEGAAVAVVLRFLQVHRRNGWDEGIEREISVPGPGEHPFEVDGLCGAVLVSAEPLPGPWGVRRIRVRVENRTPMPPVPDRTAALPYAFVASHTILGVTGGAFVSMVDPPEWAADAVAGCVNVGTWPVLAGSPSRRDAMLCAPIILYDHPEVAPESGTDFFDATEIDELLTLRTITLTDDEKREARATDPRAAALIDHAETLDPDAFLRLHGTIRSVRPVEPETVVVQGKHITEGSRVRLRPGARRADAQDMFLAGRVAVVEAVLRDVDDQPYLAVTLVDDPGADLSRSHGRFRYFAPDEVEPCDR
jgi:hypothetical protein